MKTCEVLKDPLPNGTRVRWSRVERGKAVTRRGTIIGYGFVDMPWKLYQVQVDGENRVANIHPDRLDGFGEDEAGSFRNK
jgi:hypothetical protein